MPKTLDIRRVPHTRQPYRRNGYDGPAETSYYWIVKDASGKTLDIECTLAKAKIAVTEMGAKVGKVIR